MLGVARLHDTAESGSGEYAILIRSREFVLGGVTRSILRTMTAPVLMSH
jgi:hypothetical protein